MSAPAPRQGSQAHAAMLCASDDMPAKRARIAGDARGEAGGGQLPDRRAGISAGSLRGYGMPEGHSSSHFGNERKMSLQTQKTQLEVLTKELSWVSSITIAGTKVINTPSARRVVAASQWPSSAVTPCTLTVATRGHVCCIN